MKGNILLVDDAADIRELLGAVLRENYDVTEADSGASLKACFSRLQPDVILLDIKLPDADGLELLPQIKKQWPETEVIVLTGNATFDAAVEATKRGAYHFVTKPFDTQALRFALPMAESSSWTITRKLPLTRRASSCACSRTKKSGPAAARSVTKPTAGCSPPPIARPTKPSRMASCARICFIASAPSRFICPP